MNAIAARLFLLLLLGVDWAADPAQLPPAIRLLARRMASTECFCHSLTRRSDALRTACPAGRPHGLPSRWRRAATTHLWPALLAQEPARVSLGAGLIYLFMSIRR
jgi:hypothetical protein